MDEVRLDALKHDPRSNTQELPMEPRTSSFLQETTTDSLLMPRTKVPRA